MKLTVPTSFIRAALPALASSTMLLPASAITVNLGSGVVPGTVTNIEYDISYPKWLVADVTDPVNPDYLDVVSSASSGAWTLNLTFPAGSPALVTGAVFDIEQLLTIDPASLPVSGWRQQLLTANWQWETGTVFDFDTALPLPGISTSGQGTGTLTSSFNPVSSPVNLSVAGSLKYTGAGGPASPLSLAITPVPEPGGALMVLAAASPVLLRRRRTAFTD